MIEPEKTPTATFLKIITDHLEGRARGGGIGEFVEHNRQEYYARNHLQQIEFEIARLIVAALVGKDLRLRLKALRACAASPDISCFLKF